MRAFHAESRTQTGPNYVLEGMSRRSRYLILGLALVLHNGEEALRAAQMLQFMQADAPGFLRDAYAGITVSELQGSLLILTTIAFVAVVLAAVFSAAAASAFGMMVLAALLGLNAVFHIVLSIQAGTYMPGLVTAVLITLPVSVTLLVRARQQRWVPAGAFWSVVPIALLIHGPVLDVVFRVSVSLVRE